MTVQRNRGRPPYADILTPAEWRIAEGVRHGLTNRQIADRRAISLDAVKYHVANIIGKLGLSRRAELRDWDGVAAVSALPREETMASDTFHLGAIGQISRNVSNLEKSLQWYTEKLGLNCLFSFDTVAFLDCNGTRLFLSQSETGSSPESILYFQVANIHGAKREMEARGIVFSHAPHMIYKHDDGTEEWMAFFCDPDDRPLAIITQSTPSDEEKE